jgi:hypothetical protein
VELVREAVERSRPIRLPNVLLQLLLEPEVAGIDAVKACRMRRAGDLCTASGDSLYVFLFACHVDDAGKAIGKVFERPLAELFRGELRGGDRDSILSELDTLENDIAELPPPDYSSLLAPTAASQAPADDASTDAEPPTATAELPPWSMADMASRESASAVSVSPPRLAALPLKLPG